MKAPMSNPTGFGAGDCIEILLAILLAGAILIGRPWLEPVLARFSKKTGWCLLILAALPIVLRLALLKNHPVPTPDLYDEFGHLFVADTLRHFRLANPLHPMHRFFETFFILQEPTYSSIYPVGQGLMLALGWTLSGQPWAGVLLATGLFCGLCYWMLRAWTTPGWALAGGTLAVMEFGPLNQWTNSYWGGGLAAAAGCLVFGSLPRLRETGRMVYAGLAGLGIAAHLLIRPYESIFLVLCVMLYWLPLRILAKAVPVACLAVIPAIGFGLLQNRAVTGSWTTMPYVLSQYQYGVPAALTFQANPAPHRELTREQELDYKMQSGFRGRGPETFVSFLQRLEFRVRYYRFFFLPPLYIALAAFPVALRVRRFAWAAVSAVIFALGINFFPAFQFHYLAAITCLFVLIAVVGLQQLARISPAAAHLILLLCGAHFLFWYGVHVFEAQTIRAYETWTSISHRGPERRIAIAHQLAAQNGKQLVFVRYSPQHIFQDEWVYNRADIDGAKVVWARDRGPEEDLKLCAYYPDREVWLLEPDARPPRLEPYKPEIPPPAPPKVEKKPPLIIMEDVK